MKFEWDPVKARRNLRKHGVSFEEAATIVGDPLAITFPDPDHSTSEQRFVSIGGSTLNRILIVAHTDRGESVRIINALRATHGEQKYYEEKS